MSLRAGFHGTVGQPSAQVIDGSLRFDTSKTQYLQRTFGSGNQRTFTFSVWLKRAAGFGSWRAILTTLSNNGSANTGAWISDSDVWYYYIEGQNFYSDAVVRDIGWYHVVYRVDTTIASPDSDRLRVYVNGNLMSWSSASGTYPTLNYEEKLNSAASHSIGRRDSSNTHHFDGSMTQFYFIDGQSLGPENFGFTDPLTNTWRPKKYTGTFTGTNTFYLPMDGNSPIGEDKSGNGNDWTPLNFGGSNTLEKATGALPILNTDGGGKVARVGVRTDSNSSSLVLALPLVGIKSDFSNAINSGTSNKAVTASNSVASNSQSNFYGGSWYFDGTGDTLYAANSADFNVGSGNFTVEMWLYPTAVGTSRRIFLWNGDNVGSNTSNTLWAEINTSSKVLMGGSSGSSSIVATSSQNILENTWTHVAFVRNGNTGTLYMNGAADGTVDLTGITFNNSVDPLKLGDYKTAGDGFPYSGYIQDVRVYKGTAKYTSNFIPASTNPDILPDTPSGVSGGSKITKITDGAVSFDGSGDYLEIADSDDFDFGSGEFTVEAFVEGARGGIRIGSVVLNQSISGASSNSAFYFGAGNTGTSLYLSTNGSSWTNYIECAGLVHNSGWHHIAWQRRGDVMEIYVDGIKQTVATGSNSGDAAITGSVYNSSRVVDVGRQSTSGSNFNGTISNLRVIKGTALYTSNFTPPTAPLTNVTNTVLLCCQSNTSATEAAVTPGSITANGNAAATNFNPFNTDINTVRGQESGYATLNPLDSPTNLFGTISDGNLQIIGSTNAYHSLRATIYYPTTGKWFYESTLFGTHYSPRSFDSQYSGVGFVKTGFTNLTITDGNSNWLGDNGYGVNFSGTRTDLYGANIPTGSVIGVAVDRDANTYEYFVNGVSTATGTIGVASGTDLAAFAFVYGSSYTYRSLNFGQKPFKFPPPDGFQPLNAANVRPSTVIARPDQYVGVITYVGAGATKTFTGLNFGDIPDVVWMKNKDRTSYGDSTSAHHYLYDTVRGTGTGKMLTPSTNEAEGSKSTEADLDGFVRDGFRLDAASGTDCINNSGDNFIAWCWKAGGNKGIFNVDDVGYASASAAGITDGTIALTGCSVGTKQGFSILKYTGSGSNGTIAHGLSQAPDFFFGRDLNDTGGSRDWIVYHKTMGNTGRLKFVGYASISESSTFFQNTSPTNSLITVGTSNDINSTNDYVLYCWHNVPGLQKFGGYTGNGSDDGPFIETGFRPALIWTRAYSANSNNNSHWLIYDRTINPNNESSENLYINLPNAVSSHPSMGIDILSNGFKLKADTAGYSNYNGWSYIYCAWAEAPAFNLYGGQSNAR